MNELEYFIGTVGNRRKRIFEDDGRYVLKTALAAVRSYREGRLVEVEGRVGEFGLFISVVDILSFRHIFS